MVRALFLALFFSAALLAFPGVAQPYLYPTAGTGDSSPATVASALSHNHFELYGFEIPDDAFPVEMVFVGTDMAGFSKAELAHAIEEASQRWNEVVCSQAHLQWAGFVDTFDEVRADQVPISFNPSPGALGDLVAWTNLPGSDQIPPEGLEVVLNNGTYRWALEPSPFESLYDVERPTVDLPSVLTHEFGHVLGLAHTEAHGAATMRAGYLRDGSQAELSAVDKLGICHLYPRPEDECERDADCPAGAACIESEYGSVCDIYLAEVGEYCGLELQHCRGFCLIDEESTGTGYCSTTCQTAESCPEHFECRSRADSVVPICHFAPEQTEPSRACSTANQNRLPLTVIALLLILGMARATGRLRSSPGRSSSVRLFVGPEKSR